MTSKEIKSEKKLKKPLKIYKRPRKRVSQGDVFKDVDHIEYYIEEKGQIELSKIIFPYVYVLTQDCDLAQDFTFRSQKQKTDDKILFSALVAPIYNYEFVIEGTHLSELNLDMRIFKGNSSSAINDLKNNNNPRYHYLDFGKDSILPPSIIDFKHYFSVNIMYLESIRKSNRVFKVKELYREDVSQRFSSYLSRIGLPD